MSDKLRDLSPVNVSFFSGEQPSAAKLSSWAAQIATGLENVEKALGDLWSDSHPLFASANTPVGGWAYNKVGTGLGSEQRHLQQTSLARLLGPASALNPRMLTGITASIVGETVPSGYETEFYLRYIPTSGTVIFSDATRFTTEVANADLVLTEGDYFVDYTTGRVVVFNTDSSPGTVDYNVDMSGDYMGDSYEGASFNVIPDLNQATKCTMAGPAGGFYTITLPTITDQQANYTQLASTLVATHDPNYGAQLYLPGYFAAEFIAGDLIPDGLVKLWDGDASAFVEGISFYYVSQAQIQCSDEQTLAAGSDRYSLVVVGTDICRLLDSVRSKYRKHQHNGTEGDARVKHSDLSGQVAGVKLIGTDLFGYGPHDNQFPGNVHPQYLHRAGRDSSPTQNAMLGDILLASVDTDGTPPRPFTPTVDSFKIFFGGYSSSHPAVYFDTSDDALKVLYKHVYADQGLKAGTGGLAAGQAAQFDGWARFSEGFYGSVLGDESVHPYAVRGTVVMDGTGSIILSDLPVASYGILGFRLLVQSPVSGWIPDSYTTVGLLNFSALVNDLGLSNTIEIDDCGANWPASPTECNYTLIVFYYEK